jgi:hypothetical protein
VTALVMPRSKIATKAVRLDPPKASISPEIGSQALKLATTLRGGYVDFATVIAPAIGATIANGTMRNSYFPIKFKSTHLSLKFATVP